MKRFFMLSAVSLLATVAVAAPPVMQMNTRGVAGGFQTADGAWSKYISTAGIQRGEKGFTFIFGGSLKFSPDVKTVSPEKESEAIFGGEVFEVMVSPKPESGVYYHFAVNHDGVTYTAKKRDISWEPAGFLCRVNHIRDYWEAKMFVPYEDIGMKYPADGTSMKILFARSRKNGKGILENTSWGGSSNYHDLSQFGTVQFSGKPGNVELIALVSNASGGHFIIDKGDLNTDGFTVEVFDGDGNVADVKIAREHPMLFQGGFTMSSTKGREIPMKNRMKRTLRVRDKAGRIIFERSGFVENITKQMLELDRFRLADNEKFISGSTAVAGKYRLELVDGNGKVCFGKEFTEKSFKIPVDKLAEGRYSVRLIFKNSHTEQVFVKEFLPAGANPVPAKGKWSIDGEVFKKDGVPVFLYGGSATAKNFFHRKQVFTLGAGCPGRFAGSIAVNNVPNTKKLIRKPATGYLYRQEPELAEALQTYLTKAAKASPKITRLAYEAQLRSFVYDSNGKIMETGSPEMMKRLYKQLRVKNNTDFLSLQIDRQERIDDFSGYCDVFEISCHGSYTRQPLPVIAESMADVRHKVVNKPVIYWLGVTIPDNSCRIVEELRAELFLAILNGGAGVVLHLGHGFLPAERKRLWCYMSTAADELNKVFRIVQGGKKFGLTVPQDFRAGLYEYQGKKFLVAVNLSPYPRNFVLPDGKKFYFSGWESRCVPVK